MTDPGDAVGPTVLSAIIFDAEGVVIDTESIWDYGQAEFLRRRGVVYDRKSVKPLLTGRSIVEGVEVMRDLFGFRGDTADLARERVDIVADIMARDADFMPGFAEFHGRVRSQYRLGLATAMAPELFSTVRSKLSLDSFFPDAIVTLADVGGRSKPNPDLFLAAAHLLGVRPEACAVIEDAPHGIDAARRAGMVSVGLATTYGPESLAKADVVVRTFDEIDLGALDRIRTASL